MTPKEKAKQLYNKMWTFEDENDIESMSRYNAKQCALVCVNEIIEELNTIPFVNQNEYWQEVKKEINKL